MAEKNRKEFIDFINELYKDGKINTSDLKELVRLTNENQNSNEETVDQK